MKKILLSLLSTALITSCSINAQTPFIPEQPIQPTINVQKSAINTIKIATFNIQVFGQNKLNDSSSMKIITSIVKQFDVVAIQEVRSLEQNVMPIFVNMLGNHQWAYQTSERIGRSDSKEQYAFVYRKDRVKKNNCYQTKDPKDQLHREPYVCSFTSGNFNFRLINIHTDPHEVAQEVDFLDNVFKTAQQIEKDTILIGDLNAQPKEFGELRTKLSLKWIVNDNQTTNVRETSAYDNIIFSEYTKEFTGRGGVFDFPAKYNLSRNNALRISDHMPVWGEFNTSMATDDL